jgi:hypothetical protein
VEAFCCCDDFVLVLWTKICNFWVQYSTMSLSIFFFTSAIVISIPLYFSWKSSIYTGFLCNHMYTFCNKEKPMSHWFSFQHFPKFDQPLSNKGRTGPWISHLTKSSSSKRKEENPIAFLKKNSFLSPDLFLTSLGEVCQAAA